MAFSINKIYLVGNATVDPELKYTPNGQAVLNFSMATNRSVKEKDGSYRDAPTFHRIIVWGKMAEYLSKSLRKGNPVVVEGRQENRSYKDRDGNRKYISEVVADSCIPFARKERAQQAPTETTIDQSKPATTEEAEEILTQPPPITPKKGVEKVNPDDIPF
jgi:single-strand DNA-binding protein